MIFPWVEPILCEEHLTPDLRLLIPLRPSPLCSTEEVADLVWDDRPSHSGSMKPSEVSLDGGDRHGGDFQVGEDSGIGNHMKVLDGFWVEGGKSLSP